MAEGPPILPAIRGHLLSGRMSPPSTMNWEAVFSEGEGPLLLLAMGGQIL